MRAILLAAGMGTRLRPLTEKTPKSLIKINDEPLLERQIKFLKEKGIEEIYIVVGYLKEKFDYLKEKYNVNLVYNDKYSIYNNIYSMYLVREYLHDTYVIDADVYLSYNFLKENMKKSTYFSGKKETLEKEWKIIFNENDRVEDIEIVSGENYILSGVSYWNEKDGKYINNILNGLKNKFSSGELNNLYWDNIVRNNLNELEVYIEKIESDAWYEIDTLEELENLNKIVGEKNERNNISRRTGN